MKAVQVTGPHQLSIVEREKPVITHKQDVLIKVKMVGICGSDIHIYHGTNPLATLPRVIGHEVTGVVEAVGDEVDTLSVGDMVVLEPIESCGQCYACRSGRGNVCSNLEVYGVHRDGGMQEYMVIPQKLVHKVKEELDYKESVLVEPFTIGAQANWRGDVRDGDTVFIMGAGPIGLCCLKVAKTKGATVIISDLNESRLAFAKEWGADHTIDASGVNVIEEVMELTKQEGANVVIDAVCIPQTFEQAIEAASAAGRVVVLGFDERPSHITQLPITKKEVTITGSRLQTNQFPVVIEMFNDRTIDTRGMVTQEFPLDRIQEAISLIETSPEDVRKVVISFG
ncbi:zinc-binding alcohol dehydrogenase family protein [Rossellomorea aquimaris]|jgi:threonine dehydrogenase-like Zn-dependent dehydrogenase|uniref:Zinc-binding alcohol dehydrogenase family protein n=1 Tax=Rossellomorea aquimaris TaxID=189382 RepID=A0A5D4U3U4_9BACI|nr:zinc-binding alcohol dehydrogenase family protein [Rossellomorea aquimaris]TYS81820.1 zinc-binding alcohol dehydrogenase family protein [Rossellomorea aquimaris]TYS88444.1 zinc-binding alcohol dehydrogenase family protein [Rossellomorea aquimaris]